MWKMITASTRAQKRTCGVMLYHICFNYVCKLIQSYLVIPYRLNLRRLDSGEPSHSTRASGMFFRRQEDRLNGELQERQQKIRSEENAMDAEFAKVAAIHHGWLENPALNGGF